MEDEQIVDLYWQRSDLAISETNQKYGRYCHTIAYNICGTDEDAEECVNDTWFRAWNLMPDQRPTILSAFLGRITRNFAIDCIKEKNRIKRGGGEAVLALDELEECIPGGRNPEQALEEKELEKAIGSFVSQLPLFEKKIFILRYWYLISIPQISKKMYCTEECVNDTYLGAWNAIPPHKPSPLRTFVCKIARNLATMKYHSNTADKRNSQYDLALDELEECLSDNGSVEEAYEAKELREAMGHSDIGVTLNTYTHLGLEDAAEELRRMEEAEAARREQEKLAGKADDAQKLFKTV